MATRYHCWNCGKVTRFGQDHELRFTAFRALRDLVYQLEAEQRTLQHQLLDHEFTRKGVHGL